MLIITPMLHTFRQKLNNKEIATTFTTTITVTKRPSLTIVAPAAVMTAAAIAVILLGLHIQVLCLQLVHIILSHLKVSTSFEPARKVRLRICELQRDLKGIGMNLVIALQQKYQ